MNRYPGLEYDAARKRARFDCYLPGTSGRSRRRRSVPAETRAEALRLWREFVEELAAEAQASRETGEHSAPSDKPTIVPTLREFIESSYCTIAAAFKPSTMRTQANIVQKRLLPVFADVRLDAISSVSVT